MGTYKWTSILTGIIAVLTLTAAVITNHFELNFWTNALLGIFASSLLVFISAIVSFIALNKKTKALIYYRFRQAQHIINQYKLFLNLLKPRAGERLNISKDIALRAYDVSFELSTVFVDLSINEATSIDKGVCDRINRLKEQVEKFAIDVTQKPMEWESLIQHQAARIDCESKEINDFLTTASFLGKEKKEAITNDKT